MRNKVTSAAEAVAIVQSGDAICTSGFVGIGVPDALLLALERRFVDTGEPRDLTLLFAAGQGDGKDRGLNALGHEGLLKRAIGGHWGLIPKVGRLALEGQIEAYNLPQGVISHMYRDIAAGKPGTVSRVGIGTFVDPRVEGGKINARTTEDIVKVIEIEGQDWLFYRGFPLQIAFLRGTTADPNGNITAEREALDLDNLAMAMAVKNSGGVVIVQVERIARAGSLHPRQVIIPGVIVDCVVVGEPENHRQTYSTDYDPAFSAEICVPLDSVAAMPLDERKIIARRCALELRAGAIVNLGIGMPEGVAAVAAEELVSDLFTLTAEPGVIGAFLPRASISAPPSTLTRSFTRTSSSIFMMAAGSISPSSAWPRSIVLATSTLVVSGLDSPALAASSTSAKTREKWYSLGHSRPAGWTSELRTANCGLHRKDVLLSSETASNR